MIRKYEKKDIDEIVNLENKVLGETLGAEMFNKSLYLSMAHYYVYEENKKVLGYISTSFDGEIIEILNLCVDNSYQSKGIGSKLFGYALIDLYKKGAKSAILEVRESNYGAIKFYTRFGFKKISVRKSYYKNGDTALVFQKEFESMFDFENKYLSEFTNIEYFDDYISYNDDIQKDKYSNNFYFLKNKNKVKSLIKKLSKENKRNYLDFDSSFLLDEYLPDFEKTHEIRMFNFTNLVKLDYRIGEVKQIDSKIKDEFEKLIYNDDLRYGERYALGNSKRLADIVTSNDNFKAYGIYDGNKIVGSLYVYINKEMAKIEDFFIIEEYQKKGYGISLLTTVIDILKKYGVHDLSITADFDDTPKKIYERLGFVTISDNYNYHKEQ